MASYNTKRFYHNKYDRALACYRDGKSETAEDMCAELVTDFECPQFVQVRAWQLRSMCTEDYWRIMSPLGSALKLIDTLKHDDVVQEYREHPEEMLAEAEEIWKQSWAIKGKSLPLEQAVEDTYETLEAEKDAEAMMGALAAKTEALDLGRDSSNRGGSLEVPQLSGGAEAPGLKAPEAPPSATTAAAGRRPSTPPRLPDCPPMSPSSVRPDAPGGDDDDGDEAMQE